jgi:flagellar M-ring protein FliF
MQEYRQGLEREMLAKIRATLDPLLGEDKYRAGVSIECDFRTAEQSEEQFDPDRSVMVSAQKTEDLSGAAAAAGVPGTASNLPRAAPKSPTSGGGVARRTENIHYQTSRVVKHTKMPQGSIQRISVAVLVDHALRWEGEGDKASRVLEPPSPERLKVLREVLSGVIGFRQDRGDQILVESLPFEATLRTPPPAQEPREAEAPGQPSLPPWFTSLFTKAPAPLWIGAAVCLLMVGVVAVWWLRRVVRRGKPKVSVESAAALGGSHAPDALAAAADFERKVQQQLASNEQERERQEAEVLSALKLPVHTKKSEVLKKQLSEEAKKDPAAMAQLIRTWLNEAER